MYNSFTLLPKQVAPKIDGAPATVTPVSFAAVKRKSVLGACRHRLFILYRSFNIPRKKKPLQQTSENCGHLTLLIRSKYNRIIYKFAEQYYFYWKKKLFIQMKICRRYQLAEVEDANAHKAMPTLAGWWLHSKFITTIDFLYIQKQTYAYKRFDR